MKEKSAKSENKPKDRIELKMTKQSPQDPGSKCTGAINININITLSYHRVKNDQYNRIIKSEMNNCLHVGGERNINYNKYGRTFRASRW